MNKLLIVCACIFTMLVTVLAGEEEVTVKVSVAGTNNSALRNECETKGKKDAVRKYLVKLGENKVPEKKIDEAVSSYAKFVDSVETDESEYEGGELTSSYTVTINEKALAQWLKAAGVDLNAGADGASIEIFVMEEPPDAGQIQLGDEVGNFFFTRYNMFQRRIRDALVKKVNEYGIDVVLLEDNENYEDMKKQDPVLVGVSYDINGDTKGFKVTPDFLRTVQQNNPDAIALYYRVDALAFDADTGTIRTTVALNFKSLADNKTASIGSRDFQQMTRNKKTDMIMADFGTCVERAMYALLNGEGAGQKLKNQIKSLTNKKANGPMKVVINCSQVDSKIKIKVRNGLKKMLVSSGLTTQTKVVKDSLSCVVKPSEEFGDLDDVWCKISEIIPELLGDDVEITDDWAKKNGDTLTVTIGK